MVAATAHRLATAKRRRTIADLEAIGVGVQASDPESFAGEPQPVWHQMLVARFIERSEFPGGSEAVSIARLGMRRV